MAPRKGLVLPFSRVESAQSFVKRDGTFFSRKVCGQSGANYFSYNKLTMHFPDDIVRVKRSILRTADGAAFEGKASSEAEIMASSFGMIAIFLRHSPDSVVF